MRSMFAEVCAVQIGRHRRERAGAFARVVGVVTREYLIVCDPLRGGNF